MGSSQSHPNTSNTNPDKVLESDRTRLENLIYENELISENTSSGYGVSKVIR